MMSKRINITFYCIYLNKFSNDFQKSVSSQNFSKYSKTSWHHQFRKTQLLVTFGSAEVKLHNLLYSLREFKPPLENRPPKNILNKGYFQSLEEQKIGKYRISLHPRTKYFCICAAVPFASPPPEKHDQAFGKPNVKWRPSFTHLLDLENAISQNLKFKN